MSNNKEFVFEIGIISFKKELIKDIVKKLYIRYQINNKITEKANIEELFGNGVGGHSTILLSKSFQLHISCIVPGNKEYSRINEDKFYLIISIAESEIKHDYERRERFLKGGILVFECLPEAIGVGDDSLNISIEKRKVLKSNYQDIIKKLPVKSPDKINEAIYEYISPDLQTSIYSSMFLNKSIIEKIGKQKILSSPAYKKEELSNGIFIQISEDPFNAKSGDILKFGEYLFGKESNVKILGKRTLKELKKDDNEINLEEK